MNEKQGLNKSVYIFSTVMAGICWGCISLFLKPLAASGLSSIQILLIRGVVSSVLLGCFLGIKNPGLLKISIKDVWMFFGTGIVSLTFFSYCYFTTIIRAGASVAVILLYTSPIFIMIFSFFLFKEKITLVKLVALVLTIAGCIFVTGIAGGETASQKLTLSAFLLGLCAGLGYGLYSIFSRYALAKYSSLTVTFYTFVFSAVSLIPFVNKREIIQAVDFHSSLLILGLCLLCTVLAYILYTFGLSGLENGQAAILVTIEPLVGTLIGFFVWKEDFSLSKFLGIACILVAVILMGLIPQKKD